MNKPDVQWSDELVADQFRREIHERFTFENTRHRAGEDKELEKIFAENPGRRGQPGFEVTDSFLWEVYESSEILIDRNSVTIVLPRGFAIGIDFIEMFEGTSVGWSRASIGAMVINDEPRPTIELLLVATWTDEMDAKWRENKRVSENAVPRPEEVADVDRHCGTCLDGKAPCPITDPPELTHWTCLACGKFVGPS